MSQSPSNTKHTPGPWHRNIKPAWKYPVIFAGRNTHVATIAQDATVSEAEKEANCNLIASAPELLAVLKDILFFGTVQGERLRRAQEAVAKAEGREVPRA